MLQHVFTTVKDLFKKEEVLLQPIIKSDELCLLKRKASNVLSCPLPQTTTLIGKDVAIVKEIRTQTTLHNQDNITRTNAYLQFYKRNPEIHWALLAHLVSRNGGYHMTDLKGNLLESVLSSNRKQAYFEFLERANALIFQDAYPQLLLYEESKRQMKNFFHLLPVFHVSRFMQMMWNHYVKTMNHSLLTLCLITNEQHYIDKRVIHHPIYHKQVVDTWQFTLQEFFGFTRVLFPFYKNDKVRLTGVTVQQFDSVNKRIEVGKSLYSLLFSHPDILKGATVFTNTHVHTASRSDYAPFLFSTHKKEKRIYSPTLPTAWPIVRHTFFDQSDWFNDISVMDQLSQLTITPYIDFTDQYIEKMTPLLLLSKTPLLREDNTTSSS
ncbi:DUF2515 family protein [Bacillus sp. CGMCC 1.16541]|uniref:DUF2515 family protein n=1 Tax=Bacillus sp. CGMCC 1.16541 TaxID=2185143 RepID=UPI000D7270AC|nr:DUF2515 family protein [Bacillus sp. CGMCC 1.16541]